MAKIKFDFVKTYHTRHGKLVNYVRRPGHKLIWLPGLFGSREFTEAHAAALATDTPRVEIAERRTRAGSINAAVVGYLGSADFAVLKPISQKTYRRIAEVLRRDHGDMPIGSLQRRHVVQMVERKKDTPSAARDFLKVLKLVLAYAISVGMREDDDNPCVGVKVKMPKGGSGYRTWTEAEIAAYQKFYPLDSRPRLAMEVLLHTGLRAEDAVVLGRGHVRNGEHHIVAQKTGTQPVLPITSELEAAINAAAPSEHITYLVSERTGRSYSAKRFGEWFSEQCDRAGLKGLSPHGLRKRAAERMAERGVTAPEMKAFFGWESTAVADVYIKKANRAHLSRNAAAKLRVVR